jgi:hypothetical protein
VGWTVDSWNDNGYVVGFFGAPLYGSFVYHAGSILCSVDGLGGGLNMINDNNVLVGYGLGFAPNDGGIVSVLGSGGCPFTQLHILPDPQAGLPFGSFVDYEAINNGNQILARVYGSRQEYFVLDPVPEPISTLLFVTVLAAVAVLKPRCAHLRR